VLPAAGGDNGSIGLATTAGVDPQGPPSDRSGATDSASEASHLSRDETVQTAAELIKTGQYERAIELLRDSIERATDVEFLRECYLLLIKTYVIRGNDYRLDDPLTADLWYGTAEETIRSCLLTSGLRHTRVDQTADYPHEMIDLFARVRGELFGSLRIVELEPRDALVTLDGDTLTASPDGTREEVDLLAGPHMIVVQRAGFAPLTEEIAITPGSTLERPYRLSKRRGPWWYASAAGIATAGIVAIVQLTAGSDDGRPSSPEPLPGPPDPPDD
jgi:hypothetical protein